MKYRLHAGRSTWTLIRNANVRAGHRRGRGHGDRGIPHVGVLIWLQRTDHPGARKFGLERAR